jgi:hypothetical protein
MKKLCFYVFIACLFYQKSALSQTGLITAEGNCQDLVVKDKNITNLCVNSMMVMPFENGRVSYIFLYNSYGKYSKTLVFSGRASESRTSSYTEIVVDSVYDNSEKPNKTNGLCVLRGQIETGLSISCVSSKKMPAYKVLFYAESLS